jgi:hypothetical protein
MAAKDEKNSLHHAVSGILLHRRDIRPPKHRGHLPEVHTCRNAWQARLTATYMSTLTTWLSSPIARTRSTCRPRRDLGQPAHVESIDIEVCECCLHWCSAL